MSSPTLNSNAPERVTAFSRMSSASNSTETPSNEAPSSSVRALPSTKLLSEDEKVSSDPLQASSDSPQTSTDPSQVPQPPQNIPTMLPITGAPAGSITHHIVTTSSHPIVVALLEMHHRCRPGWFDYKSEMETLSNRPEMFAWAYWLPKNEYYPITQADDANIFKYDEVVREAEKNLRKTRDLPTWDRVYSQLAEVLNINYEVKVGPALEEIERTWGREMTRWELDLVVAELGLTAENAGCPRYTPVPATHTIQYDWEAPVFELFPLEVGTLHRGFPDGLPVAKTNPEDLEWEEAGIGAPEGPSPASFNEE